MTGHYLSPALTGQSTPLMTSALSTVEAVIHGQIRNAVLDRRLLPGTKLMEGEIGAMFEVSRTVVRKVLLILEQEGVVALPPNRGAFIRSPDKGEVMEALDALHLICGAIVRRLAGEAEEAERNRVVRQLQSHLETQREADGQGADSAHRLGIEFFVLLGHLSGNRVLWSLQERNLICLGQALVLFQKTPLGCGHNGFQQAVVEAIGAGDQARAATALANYVSGIQGSLRLVGEDTRLHLRSILRVEEPDSLTLHRVRGASVRSSPSPATLAALSVYPPDEQ